jgi:hypothetical protein
MGPVNRLMKLAHESHNPLWYLSKKFVFLPLNHGFCFFLVILRGRDSCETPHVIKSDGKSRILKDGSNILANTGFEPPMWNFDNSKSHLAKSVL